MENNQPHKCEIHGIAVWQNSCLLCQGDAISAEVQQKLHEERVAGRRKKFTSMFGHACIPPRFMQRGFSTYITNDQPEKIAALNAARNYADDFPARLLSGTGLMFCGSHGTGKTHLACSIGKQVLRAGYSVLFVSTLRITQMVRESYRSESTMSELDVIRSLTDHDLLIMDELGVQRGTEAENLILTELFNQRYENNKPTILISNLGPKQLEPLLGTRIIDRMSEVNPVVPCVWESHRAQVDGGMRNAA